MKAAEFIEKVKDLKPDRSFLADKDLPDEFIEELLSSYDLQPKETFRSCDSELKELLYNYEMKGFEVAGITFQGETSENNGFIVFAHIELDELAIDETDGKVKLLSYETGEILYECASDAEAFLDATYEMVKIITERIKSGEFTDPCADSVRLSELSNLPVSIDFYRWNLGCDMYASTRKAATVNPRDN